VLDLPIVFRLYWLTGNPGFRLSSEHPLRPVKDWKKVNNGNVVSVHDAFTTRVFGDSSLIIVQDYFPLSKTLYETHFASAANMHGTRPHGRNVVPEHVLWSYAVQISNALRSIHTNNLAARCIELSKIIVTDKNRIRLSACGILDVVKYETPRPMVELQQEDFIQFGKVLLCLATNTLPNMLTNIKYSLEQMGRSYTPELRETVTWLLSPAEPPQTKSAEEFIRGIAPRVQETLDQSMHSLDTMNSELFKEIENGRLFRLLAKLGTINERMDYEGDRAWSENGERYMLKLYRDYVFHQVDAQGNPVIDMGHIIRSLNKLDVGSEENVCLTSRDNQTSFVVTYRELKKQLANSFSELIKGNKQGGRGPL
jgi:PAB-dependent poly(A)-specific ribonuclease subunit 3